MKALNLRIRGRAMQLQWNLTKWSTLKQWILILMPFIYMSVCYYISHLFGASIMNLRGWNALYAELGLFAVVFMLSLFIKSLGEKSSKYQNSLVGRFHYIFFPDVKHDSTIVMMYGLFIIVTSFMYPLLWITLCNDVYTFMLMLSSVWCIYAWAVVKEAAEQE